MLVGMQTIASAKIASNTTILKTSGVRIVEKLGLAIGTVLVTLLR
jgi:hypothetical protein